MRGLLSSLGPELSGSSDSRLPQATLPGALETPKISEAGGGSYVPQGHRQDLGFNLPLQPQETAVA